MADFRMELDNSRWRKSLPKFWSDDFDVDLLKVFPGIRHLLGPTIDVPVWTVGHSSFGRLNSPAQWNMPFGSFLWLSKPNLPRDKNGWVNINGCVCDQQEIEGTWLEWLRDAWAHDQSWTVLPRGVTFAGIDYNRCFYPIMANIRGWEGYENVDKQRRMALLWLKKANRRFTRVVEEFSLGREPHPYFRKPELRQQEAF